jgi:2-polyprenyl-3-methyl-5-hydroxy-6-metoxy-1,4-benzoquinol methylase
VNQLEKLIEYSCLPGPMASVLDGFMEQCSELYSNHYGRWGNSGRRPGENIMLSKVRVREWLQSNKSIIYYAKYNEKLIGYAIAVGLKEKYGIITWVTQLVVHKDFRKQGIAKNLLFSIWGFTDHYAWGIVSANPYAIRALEKATRRRCLPIRIMKNQKIIKRIGKENVTFIHSDTELVVTEETSKINTKFFLDHGNIPEMIRNAISNEVPWVLGLLEEGWEWFAFTFNDQEQIELTQNEIENMVLTSDSVVKLAYSRMNLNNSSQVWMKHTNREIDFIIEKSDLKQGQRLYDLGCGNGRHSIELANRGIQVIGIDYIEENIEYAKKVAYECNLSNIKFITDDCRTYKNNEKADVVICIYDVIGSFIDNTENMKILHTIYELLKPNGKAIISVMNYELTISQAKYTFTFSNQANKLLNLSASNIMEQTGNVFNPDYYIVDDKEHVVYRKEQFASGNKLPVELIVRDRRFTMSEIETMCEIVGFKLIEKKYMNATDWNIDYESTDKKAKEILLICQK